MKKKILRAVAIGLYLATVACLLGGLFLPALRYAGYGTLALATLTLLLWQGK